MQKVRRLYGPTAFFLGFPALFQLSFNFPSQYYFTIGISILWFIEGGAPSSKWLLSISLGDGSSPGYSSPNVLSTGLYNTYPLCSINFPIFVLTTFGISVDFLFLVLR